MTQFVIGFVVYTLGTIGLLLIGYIGTRYFLNQMNGPKGNKDRSFLSVEQSIGIEPRKIVHVLKAGNQRFLIATTPENVSCLGELAKDNVQNYETRTNEIQNTLPKMHPDLEAKLKYTGFIRDAINKQLVKR
jgi:flagellar biogenesis protein FliO